MTSCLLLISMALAAPIPEPEEEEPADKAFFIPVVATSETGRHIIQGTRVDIVAVAGFATRQYSMTTMIADVPVSFVERSQVAKTLQGRPINKVWIKVTASQQALLDLSTRRGKLIVKLHPIGTQSRDRPPDIKYRSLIRGK